MFLDTSFCIDLIQEWRRGHVGPAAQKLRALGNRPLYISLFVLCELEVGARLARDSKLELQRVATLTELAEVVYPGPGFPALYADIEVHLRREGTPVPTMDILIGAMARINGQPLLARDPEHFARIPGLVVETCR